MLNWGVFFLLLSIVTLVFGLNDVAGVTPEVGWWVLGGGIILAVIFVVLGRGNTNTPPDSL